MKRLALLLALVLCSAALLQAAEPKDKKDDGGKGKAMTGMLCNSKCVTNEKGKSACSKTCSETTGDMVFIDSKGNVMKIENQDKVSGMSGHKVKMKATMMDKDMMHVDDVAPVTY